jgi:translation initiation factor 1
MKKNNAEVRLVYTTDPALNKKCARCQEFLSQCDCKSEPDFKNSKFVAYLRLEKAGRGGKIVTVIAELPKIETFLKDLTSEIKKKCGTGGTYLMDRKEGVIEIQGDKMAAVRKLLEAKGIKTKGS